MSSLLEEYLNKTKAAPDILYHATQIQNLKYLDPVKTRRTHLKYLKGYVFASDDKSFSAGFCFDWSNLDGFRFGQSKPVEPWWIQIPKKFIDKLDIPCSIYYVSGRTFRKVYGSDFPEFYSKEIVKIVKEEKYKTVKECLQKNHVKIVIS